MATATHESRQALFERARQALVRGLQEVRPAVSVDADGRTPRVQDNLADGIERSWYDADFIESTGADFETEMREVHASSALAVNAFAPWRPYPSHLLLTGRTGFRAIRFDKICPTPLDGPPAYLDAFAEAPGAVVGIEIKCLEYLVAPSPKYLRSYEEANAQALRDITDERAGSGWFDEIKLSQRDPNAIRFLFAAQLIKQFIALTHQFPKADKTLLYLYWEPTNWQDFDLFRSHRAELGRFAAAVTARDAGVRFRHQTFAELFSAWVRQPQPAWLAAHARWLASRYTVAI
jgi:hypothetical protein